MARGTLVYASKALLALAGALAMSMPTFAEVASSQKPIKCRWAPLPAAPVGADGYGVFGAVTVTVRFADGKAETVDLVTGKPELLNAAEGALRRYDCDKGEGPRTLTMTFEFVNQLAMQTSPFPPSDQRNGASGSNSLVHRYFPTRVDAVLNVAEMDPSQYEPVRILEDAPMQMTRRATTMQGNWRVRLIFMVEADGLPTDIAVESQAPQEIRSMALDALRKSKFAPATYAKSPVPTANQREFTLGIN